jgi:hypothetical protein
MPALPLDEAGKYVAGAYVAFFAVVLIYVVIMAVRLQRLEREIAALDDLAARKEREESASGSSDSSSTNREGVLEQSEADRLHQDAGLEAPRR